MNSVGWEFLEVPPQKSDCDAGSDQEKTGRLFECKCNAKLNSSGEVNEHFKTCYQMFLGYGNFMKSFMQLKESAANEP